MKLHYLAALLLLCLPLAAAAQKPDTILPVIAYGEPKEYEIGGVRVSGINKDADGTAPTN